MMMNRRRKRRRMRGKRDRAEGVKYYFNDNDKK